MDEQKKFVYRGRRRKLNPSKCTAIKTKDDGTKNRAGKILYAVCELGAFFAEHQSGSVFLPA